MVHAVVARDHLVVARAQRKQSFQPGNGRVFDLSLLDANSKIDLGRRFVNLTHNFLQCVHQVISLSDSIESKSEVSAGGGHESSSAAHSRRRTQQEIQASRKAGRGRRPLPAAAARCSCRQRADGPPALAITTNATKGALIPGRCPSPYDAASCLCADPQAPANPASHPPWPGLTC